MLIEGQVGPQLTADGGINSLRQGRLGALVVTELHGRFYEQTFRQNVFCGGMTTTSINAATFTSATTGATATPIVGVWNPPGTGKNLVILQASLGVTVTAGTATGGGPFVWMVATNISGISTGATPFNRATLQQTGSVAKNMSGAALTGLTGGALAVMVGSALLGGLIKNVSSVETAVGQNIGVSGISVENFDGSLIVPPGGVLALMATTTPVAHSAASGLVWEEIPAA